MSERHTITRIRQMLEEAGLQPRHDLGQNFLIDLNLLELIVQSAELSPDDVVLEVGTGTGSLTAQLAQRARHVVAVEYDPQMARLTAAAVEGRKPGLGSDQPGFPVSGESPANQSLSRALGNVTLLNQDVLRNKNNLADEVLEAISSLLPRGGEGGRRPDEGVARGQGNERDSISVVRVSPDPAHSTTEGLLIDQRIATAVKRSPPHPNPLPHGGEGAKPGHSPLKLVANLPYHVATPIISNLMATELPWSRMVVTIQLELAERMTAAPKTSDYSALTVWLQSQCRIEILRRLPPSVFWPKPKVDSAIVRIDRDYERQAKIHDRPAFHDFLRDIFTQRRKHLLGVVARLMSDRMDRAGLEAIHHALGWPTTIRAEELSVEQFVEYHNRLTRL